MPVEDAAAYYEGMPGVLYTEPDCIVTVGKTPDDPQYVNGTLWGMTTVTQP